MKENSLIFIPDISGFSSFVSETEINHSQHIIQELLELIIDADSLGMTVSEIEGDAVLFYKKGVVPSRAELKEQAEKTYLAFHRHLLMYKHQRICECGACRSASDLGLKFIAHAGPIQEMQIKKHKKLYGSAVIEAHRLLKNSIPGHEYLLLTQSLPNTGDEDFHPGSEEFPDVGEIHYNFKDLSPLKKVVRQKPPQNDPQLIANPIVHEFVLNEPILTVYEVLSNLEHRHLWQKQIQSIDWDEGKVNREGQRHTCVIGRKSFEIETVSRESKQEGQIIFGERVEKAPIVKKLTAYFILTPQGSGTHLRMEMHYINRAFPGKLMEPIFRRFARKNFKKLEGDLREVLPRFTASEASFVN